MRGTELSCRCKVKGVPVRTRFIGDVPEKCPKCKSPYGDESPKYHCKYCRSLIKVHGGVCTSCRDERDHG